MNELKQLFNDETVRRVLSCPVSEGTLGEEQIRSVVGSI